MSSGYSGPCPCVVAQSGWRRAPDGVEPGGWAPARYGRPGEVIDIMRIRRFVGTCGVVLGGLGLVLVGPAGPAGAAPVVVEYGSGITTNSQPTIVTTGSRLEPLVHGVRRQQDRPDDPERSGHRVLRGHHGLGRVGGITVGADGNLWFAEGSANKVGRITPSGSVAEFAVPTVGASPQYLTLGSDGNVWFTEHGVGKIGRITPSGSVTEFSNT